MFFRLYSSHLASEKRALEESHDLLGDRPPPPAALLREMEKASQMEYSQGDEIYIGLLHHLIGAIYLKQKNRNAAQQAFLKSIEIYPLIWDCWIDLIASCGTLDEGTLIFEKAKNLCQSSQAGKLILEIATVVFDREFYQQNAALYSRLDELDKILPNLRFLKAQRALVCADALSYPAAEALFDELLKQDPHGLDHMDTYLHILYVTENKPKLAFLAHFASSIDKFRPETCCIVANFYSLKFEHEKAIMYYKRALNLNRGYLGAWTLMGHEFLELKNSHAAIESYRRAVDISPKDFRAWYGLGQAYEVLDMFLYSLYYYQKACELRPLDRRMWSALANCYEKLDKPHESISAYKKIAEVSLEPDDVSFVAYKLGRLYESLGEWANAEMSMMVCFSQGGEKSAKACLWLARRAVQRGDYKRASELVRDFSGTSSEIEESRAIQKMINERG